MRSASTSLIGSSGALSPPAQRARSAVARSINDHSLSTTRLPRGGRAGPRTTRSRPRIAPFEDIRAVVPARAERVRPIPARGARREQRIESAPLSGGLHGLGRLGRTRGIPRTHPHLLRRETAGALQARRRRRVAAPIHHRTGRLGDVVRRAELGPRPDLRAPRCPRRRPGVGRRARRRGPGRPRLGEGARRRGTLHAGAVRLQRGARARRRTARRRDRRDVPRLTADGLRQRGAAGEVHAADRARRRAVGAGLLRARRRLRPRLAAVARQARRRRVRAQRTEDLVHPADRRLDVRPRAHRPGRAEAQGHLLPHDRGLPHRGHLDAADRERGVRPQPRSARPSSTTRACRPRTASATRTAAGTSP